MASYTHLTACNNNNKKIKITAPLIVRAFFYVIKKTLACTSIIINKIK
jgi:hypothetical protein